MVVKVICISNTNLPIIVPIVTIGGTSVSVVSRSFLKGTGFTVE